MNLKKNKKDPEQNKLIIAGLDEVGRGPWAGPIVACAYIQKIEVLNIPITDSKLMNKAQRELAYEVLIRSGEFGIGVAEPYEIDKFGLSKANQMAFRRALSSLQIRPDIVLIDGNDKIKKENILNIPFKTVVKGDLHIKQISSASIIAKVTRDKLMEDYSQEYPQYSFDEHKGYGTQKHADALKKHGPCKIHRKCYKPVKELIVKKVQTVLELKD